MALRQQPDHVVVPRLANVRARPITLFQLLNAEMIRHVRHARPLRFIAHQANCFAPPRESADSISRKPYECHLLRGRYPSVIAPTGSCATPVGLSSASAFSLVRRVLAGCTQSLLPTGASRRYL